MSHPVKGIGVQFQDFVGPLLGYGHDRKCNTFRAIELKANGCGIFLDKRKGCLHALLGFGDEVRVIRKCSAVYFMAITVVANVWRDGAQNFVYHKAEEDGRERVALAYAAGYRDSWRFLVTYFQYSGTTNIRVEYIVHESNRLPCFEQGIPYSVVTKTTEGFGEVDCNNMESLQFRSCVLQ